MSRVICTAGMPHRLARACASRASCSCWHAALSNTPKSARHRIGDRIASPRRLSLTEPVAQAVGRDDVEDFPGHAVVFLDVEVGELLLETVRLEFGEQRRQVLHMEGAA